MAFLIDIFPYCYATQKSTNNKNNNNNNKTGRSFLFQYSGRSFALFARARTTRGLKRPTTGYLAGGGGGGGGGVGLTLSDYALAI